MTAPLLPQVLLTHGEPPQAELDLATEGVLRYVWRSVWGDMLIEVEGGAAFVNGRRVQAAMAAGGSRTPC